MSLLLIAFVVHHGRQSFIILVLKNYIVSSVTHPQNCITHFAAKKTKSEVSPEELYVVLT